jgi:hypothetical protein
MPMLRIKYSDGRLGIILAVGASLFLWGLQGCSQLPFGHSDPPPPADDSIVSATAAPQPMPDGALTQTMVMPGTTPDAPANPAPAPLALTVPAIPSAAEKPGVTTIPIGADAVVKAEMKKFTFHSPDEERRYNLAAGKFPGFCHDWERMLRDRETNSLAHLNWVTHGGVESTTYTGYGQIDSCETKESVEGVPIGKLSYMEMIYDLEGKTPEQARLAPPKILHQTHTLEIFSWDKNKWFY